MIHRALFGSFERFIAILIEHYAGAFPLWLAPVQVMVLAVADRHVDYGHQVVETLDRRGLRAEIDVRGESMGRKIADAEHQRIPCILVVGDREVQAETVSVRRRGEGDLGSDASGRPGRRALGRGRGQERLYDPEVDLEAGAVAAVEVDGVLHRAAIVGVGSAAHADRRRARACAQMACVRRLECGRFDRLVRVHRPHPEGRSPLGRTATAWPYRGCPDRGTPRRE